MDAAKTLSSISGALSTRSILTSFTIHVTLVGLLLLIPAEAWRHSPPPRKQVDVVFHKAQEVTVPAPASALPPVKKTVLAGNAGAPAPARHPKPEAQPGPDKPGNPALPP